MTSGTDSHEFWQVKMLQPRFVWKSHSLLPAEVGEGLCDVMLARENLLEDAHFQKIVPNRYIVELSEENYKRNYRPIEQHVLRQWEGKLLEYLTTTNSRQGRKDFRFGGPVQIEIRPTPDLQSNQVRILSRIQPEVKGAAVQAQAGAACLMLLPGDRRWTLSPGINTIGRDASSDIYLDLPQVQERRLISRFHAHLRVQGGEYRLFDGSPDGKPSANGTYVNYQRVPPEGIVLQDGDYIILGAIKPGDPRPETPGVAAIKFSSGCRE